MKKLGLSLMAAAGMLLATQTMQAQTEGEIEEVNATVETEAKSMQDDYTEVDVVTLPQAIKDAVMTDYNGAVTEEAWMKEKDGKVVYKLKLNVNGETEKAYIDQDGNWIDKDKKKKDKDSYEE
ncbi:hypothetical protein ACW6QP_02550 [Salegentibacter sp. HM20]